MHVTRNKEYETLLKIHSTMGALLVLLTFVGNCRVPVAHARTWGAQTQPGWEVLGGHMGPRWDAVPAQGVL